MFTSFYNRHDNSDEGRVRSGLGRGCLKRGVQGAMVFLVPREHKDTELPDICGVRGTLRSMEKGCKKKGGDNKNKRHAQKKR